MTTPERRNFQRFPISSAVSLAVPETVELHGQAVDASKVGVLLEARGRLNVRLTINGREYRGWLAPVSPVGVSRTAVLSLRGNTPPRA